jgi:hypothetical protein
MTVCERIRALAPMTSTARSSDAREPSTTNSSMIESSPSSTRGPTIAVRAMEMGMMAIVYCPAVAS